jgi:hypothetical protein
MSKEAKERFIVVMICVAMLGLAIGGFKLERWLNWRLDYGARVEDRVKEIERRLDALEKNH